MADNTIKTGITDLPYVDVPILAGVSTVRATSGTIAGQKISLGQTEAGQGSNAIGQVSQKGNEYFYVGSASDALILLGQLKQKTSVDQYGIWIGTTGQYLKYTTADGLVIHGGGIQAGNIHIPDIDTTDDSFHVDDDGNLWIGCTKTAFDTNPKNAKAYILKNGDAYFGNAEISGALHIPDKDTTDDSLHIDTSGNLYIGCTESDFIASPDNAKARIDKNGNANFKNATIQGVLKTTVFQKDVVSAVGGQLIVSNSDVLDVDMTALDSCKLTIKGASSFALNSILLIKDGVNEEWLRVTNIASAPEYTVARDLASAYTADDNPAWGKGTAVVVMGLSDGSSAYSGGWLRLFGAGTNAPHYSVFARNGVAYNAYNEACRIGNLNGVAGKASDCYGLFLGDYSSKKYLIYDNISNEFELSGNIKPIIYKIAGRDLKAGRAVRGAMNSVSVWYANDFTNDSVQKFLGIVLSDTLKGSIAPIQVLGESSVSGVSSGLAYYPYSHLGAQCDLDNANQTLVSGYSYAQTFITDASTDGFIIVDKAILKLTIGGNADGWLRIYNTSSGTPTTPVNSDHEIYIYNVTGTNTYIFERPLQLEASTTYALVFSPTSVSGTNYIRYYTPSYYASGNMLVHNGSTWTNYATRDLYFQLFYSRGLVTYTPGIVTYKVGLGIASGKLLIKG